MQGSDFAALAVILVMILGPMAAGAKKGMDEGVTRDTPVMASPAPAPATPPPSPAK
jgi:hypothetical protein